MIRTKETLNQRFDLTRRYAHGCLRREKTGNHSAAESAQRGLRGAMSAVQARRPCILQRGLETKSLLELNAALGGDMMQGK
jgi:hypothetical protein